MPSLTQGMALDGITAYHPHGGVASKVQI